MTRGLEVESSEDGQLLTQVHLGCFFQSAHFRLEMGIEAINMLAYLDIVLQLNFKVVFATSKTN